MLFRPDEYRVRLAADLYPYTGKQLIQVEHISRLGPDCEDWQPIDCNFFQSAFHKRNPLNVPGPFYGAETDTCETGPAEAPKNVLLDHNGQEFVCKQPSDQSELRDIISAALCEYFVGYGADGDDHWTLRLIREWWASRNDLLAKAVRLHGDPESIATWKRMLSGEAEHYLRQYAFLVEERRLPAENDPLPAVS